MRQMLRLHWRRVADVLNHSGRLSVQKYVEWQLSVRRVRSDYLLK